MKKCLSENMIYQMSDFGHGCTKGLLLTLNILCIVVAVFIFGFAVVDTRILHEYGKAETAGNLVGDILIISTCVFLVVVAVFGCYGVLRNSVKVLYLYVGFLMILVVLELMVGIYMALQRFGLEYRVMDFLREDFYRNATHEDAVQRHQRWEYLQANYECCGLNGPEDYPALGAPISLPCCPYAFRARSELAQKKLYRSCLTSGTYYSQGCEDAILYVLRDSADCMIGIASMGFWFEVTGIVLALLVAHNLKNRVEVYKQTTKY